MKESNFIQNYPYPVGLPYAIAHSDAEPLQRRVWAVPFTALQAIKLSALPVVAQYLSDPKDTEELINIDKYAVERVNQAIAGIKSPFYSDWITLLGTLTNEMPKLGIQPCFPLTEFANRIRSKSIQPLSERYAPRGRKELKPLEAMQFLRNGLAHGGELIPDDECRRVLVHYLPILNDLMGCFDFLTQAELWALAQDEKPCPFDSIVSTRRLVGPALSRSCEETKQEAKGTELLEPKEMELDDDLIAAFEQSPLVMKTPDGKILALYPLFYQSPTEPCAQYDGHFAIGAAKEGGLNGGLPKKNQRRGHFTTPAATMLFRRFANWKGRNIFVKHILSAKM